MCSHIAVSSDKPLLSTSIAGVPKKIKTINYRKQEFGYNLSAACQNEGNHPQTTRHMSNTLNQITLDKT